MHREQWPCKQSEKYIFKNMRKTGFKTARQTERGNERKRKKRKKERKKKARKQPTEKQLFCVLIASHSSCMAMAG